jgi:hypothetical protein
MGTSATGKKVLQDIGDFFPSLSGPLIVAFLERSSKQPHTPQYYSVFEHFPATWTTTNPSIDDWWQTAVDDEPQVADAPSWFNSQNSHRVEPFGSVDALFVVMSSFLPGRTSSSTAHMDLATINDSLHKHTAHMYTKLGFNRDMYHDPSSMFHFDTLSLHIGVDGVPSKATWDKVPKHTRVYWAHLAYELLSHCVNAVIVLLIGGTAKETYMRYLRAKDIDFERI